MTIHISFNGKDIAEYGLVALDGTLNAFMTPYGNKALVKNENSAMDGTMYVTTTTRMVKEGVVTVPFLLRSASFNDQMRDIETLRADLNAGKNNSGMNEVYVEELDTTFYLVFSDFTKRSNFGMDGYCLLSIKFIEPNPNNRVIA